jgi:AraC family transcriptional regulator of adaptative response/methylated-DNA-[protein]-cysteine methyltransferase
MISLFAGKPCMSDYDKIATAIEYIRAHVDKQPTLAEIAAAVHLSEYHFQRLFSRWAGVTPKRYLQALTLERAKKMLREAQVSSLDASLDVGLSSGSRLYDHFVQIEAVTPSEYRTMGRGLRILYGYQQTPFGKVFLAQTNRGICQLDFVEPDTPDRPINLLREQWPDAEISENPEKIAATLVQVFSFPKSKHTPISLWVRGTNFQINVWRALLNIPSGEVTSYSQIAHAIGKPSASRAVGTAIGANPVGLVIPCHRVLRRDGELGGYRWGEIRKQAILARETAQTE